MSDITYRLLPADEWYRLKDIYPENTAMPSPIAASAVVAEDGDQLVGVLFVQLAFHMEPIVITDANVDFRRMVRLHDEQLKEAGGGRYYAFAPESNSKIGRMAEIAGMTPLDYRIYMKEV